MSKRWVHLLFAIKRAGEKFILSINHMPVGFWTVEDFSTMDDFERRFMAGDFTDIILPRLEHTPEADDSFIDLQHTARQMALAEAEMRAEARAKVWREKAEAMPAPSVFSMFGQRNDVDYIRYMAKVEEAEAIAAQMRDLKLNPTKGRINQ